MPEPSAEIRRALIQRDIEECEDAQPRWDAVWKDAVAAGIWSTLAAAIITRRRCSP